jgi:hypothetical protein
MRAMVLKQLNTPKPGDALCGRFRNQFALKRQGINDLVRIARVAARGHAHFFGEVAHHGVVG